jgi:DNA-directed RNA polymerase specialized sigma24 family protein
MEPTEELIERAKKGDRDAFGALIQPVLASGFRLAAGILRDRHAAEDATQDAVLTAWRKLGNLRSGAPLERWFLAIVANRCRKVWHHRNRQTVIPDREPLNADGLPRTVPGRTPRRLAVSRLPDGVSRGRDAPVHTLAADELRQHSLPGSNTNGIRSDSRGASRQKVHPRDPGLQRLPCFIRGAPRPRRADPNYLAVTAPRTRASVSARRRSPGSAV